MKIIDIHTHGIGGYDTRTTDAGHILKIAEIHGSAGVSEIIPTIYPAAIKVMRENMLVVKKAMERQKSNDALPPRPPLSKGGDGGVGHFSLIKGVHLEGPFLNPSKCGSLNAITFIEPSEYHLQELVEGFEDIIKIITLAPELNGAKELIKKITGMGIIVSMGHSDATYAEAEAGFKAGARGITHIFNAMRGFHHREPGLAGFGLMNRDIYIEVIADTHHLHHKTMELLFRLKNHDRIIIVSDSVKETGTTMSLSAHLTAKEAFDGKLPGIADAHGRLIGGCMTIADAAVGLVSKRFDKDIVMKCITENPERYMAS